MRMILFKVKIVKKNYLNISNFLGYLPKIDDIKYRNFSNL